MKVEEFNIKIGLYIFEFENIDTEFHSHPANEIMIAKKGDFTLWIDNVPHKNLKFAIVPSNQKHKLSSTNCELKIIMIEHHHKLLLESLEITEFDVSKGYLLQNLPDRELIKIEKLVQIINNGQALNEYDSRISTTIEYLNKNDLEYDLMINTLTKITKLSESRLSHLFKSNVGVSLKKYLVWSRLKSTIKKHLHGKDDLFTALIKSGFYDQPHFSKSFKNMLGVKPTKAYNSRNLQVLSKTDR